MADEEAPEGTDSNQNSTKGRKKSLFKSTKRQAKSQTKSPTKSPEESLTLDHVISGTSSSHVTVTMDSPITTSSSRHYDDIRGAHNDVMTGEQLKEALRLLGEVLYSLIYLLINVVQDGCQKLWSWLKLIPGIHSANHSVWLLFALLVKRICPDSRSKRNTILIFAIGFMCGSFIYVSMLNVSYAIHYEPLRYRAQVTTALPYLQTTIPPQYLAQRSTMGPSVHHITPKQLSYEEMAKTNKLLAKYMPLPTELEGQEGRTRKMKIPNIFHQGWHVKLVPQKFAGWMASWRKNHPRWRHLFWTSKGSQRIIDLYYPDYKYVFSNYSSEFHKYKVSRYFVLHHYGGVFTDLDMESLKPLDSLLARYSCILTEQPLVHQAVLFNQESPNYVLNSFMACAPGHPFLKFLLEMLETYQSYDSDIEPESERVEKSVGSLFLGDALQLYKVAFNRTVAEQVHVLPPEWLMPNYDQKHLKSLSVKCLSHQELTAKARQVCDRLLRTDFSSSPGPEALNKCHWVDLYDEKTRVDLTSGPVIEVEKI